MVKSWSVSDFILIWIGGFIGTGLFIALSSTAEGNDWLLVFGLAGQYVGNLGVLWLLRTRKKSKGLGFTIEPRDVGYLFVGLILQISLAYLFLPISQLLFPDGRPQQQVAEALSNIDSSPIVTISLILAAVVLAPVTEELIFRGVLLRALANRGRIVVIVVTAALFSAIHILGLDTERLLASAAVVLPPIFLLGLLLAYITLRTGRLGPAIFLHSGWNLLAALVLLIPTEVLENIS